MDWTLPTAQLLGRFQPWHDRHTELFKSSHERTGQVAIMLIESDGTTNNPLTVDQRAAFIVEVLEREGYVYKQDYEIIPVPNIVTVSSGKTVYKIQHKQIEDEE
jgi:nicotinamide mononucleotide adenylyltransferase